MEIVQLLLQIVKKYGIVAGIHTVILASILFIIIKRTVKGKNIWEFIRDSFEKKGPRGLSNHPMFVNLRRYINYDIQHLVINDRIREAIFKDFLLIKFSVIQKHFETFLSRGDLDLMSDDLYYQRMTDSVAEIIKSYENKVRDEGIPAIVVVKFSKWHEDIVFALYDYIKTVCDDRDIYTDNYAKTTVIFDFVNHINNLTLLSAKKTLIDLNGEISKLTYKGIRGDDAPGGPNA